MSWSHYIAEATDGWPMTVHEFALNLAEWFASDPFGDWPGGFTARDVVGGVCRKKEIVAERHIILHILHKRTDMTLATLGGVFDRHHASVIHANRRCANCDKFEPLLAKKLHAAEAKTVSWSVAC